MTSRQRQHTTSSLPERARNHHREVRQIDEWLNSGVPADDTTFQIPHDVNASSNHLLLEDDDLDFLGGEDYTITLAQSSHRDVLTLASTPRNGRKSHTQAPSNSPLTHDQQEASEPADEYKDMESRTATPTPRGRSGAKRVSVTKPQAAPGPSSLPPTVTNTSTASGSNRDRDRHSPFLSPTSPTPTFALALEAPPFEIEHEHMTIGDHSSERGASCNHRAVSDVLIASPQAPPLRKGSARSPSKTVGASPVSTATYASPSDSSSRPAVRAPSSKHIHCASQDDQHRAERAEAEQVDTITLKFKAPRLSELTMMDRTAPQPSSSSSRTDLRLDVGSGSGLSALSETGVQDTEIESRSPDLPDSVRGAAHAGRDWEQLEDLRASRGAASIPKIGKAVPASEARIEIQMKDKRAEKTNPASEQMKTKKAARTASSSSSAFAAPAKTMGKPDRKRKLEIDFKAGKSEKLGGQPAVKKTKLVRRNSTSFPGPTIPTELAEKTTECNSSTSLIDKKTEMNAAPVFLSAASEERPAQVHPPLPSMAHDVDVGVETTQHVHTTPNETMRGCELEEKLNHGIHSEQPQTTIAKPPSDSELLKERASTLDDRSSAGNLAPQLHGRTKLKDLDLRKKTKRPPRSSKENPKAKSEGISSDSRKVSRTAGPPRNTEKVVQQALCNQSSSQPPPQISTSQTVEDIPHSRVLHEGLQSATEPSHISSDFRVGLGSDRASPAVSSTVLHSTGAGTSDRCIPEMQAASVPSLSQDLELNCAIEHDEVASGSLESKETSGSVLAEVVVDSTPLEPPSQTSGQMAQSKSGALIIAAASMPPHATSCRSPTRMNVKLKTVHPADEQKGKAKGRANVSRQGSQRAQPPADDMFERKKRDTYLHKGIDLSAHSTTRFQKASKDAQARSNANVPKHPQADFTDSGKQRNSRSGSRPTAALPSVAGRGTSTFSRSEPISAARSTDTAVSATSEGSQITVVPANSVSDISPNEYSASSSSRPFTGQEITDVDYERRRIALEPIEESPEREIRKKDDRSDLANVSTSSIGNAIAERLVSFGQKVIGTLGLLSSHSESHQAEKEYESPVLTIASQQLGLKDQMEHTTRNSPLRLSELSPRKARSWDAQQGCETSDGNQWATDDDMDHRDHLDPVGTEYTTLESMAESHERDTNIFAKAGIAERPSRKRSNRPEDGYTRSSIQEDGLDERNQKRSKLSRADADGMTSSSSAKVSKEKPSSQSSLAGKRRNGRSGGPVKPSSNSTRKYTGATASSSQRQNSLALNSKSSKGDPKYFCSLTVPITTTFTGDLLRQQRAIAKAEREGSDAGKGSQVMERLTKSADSQSTVRGMRVPLSDKQRDTNLAPKPTIPQAFNFETDTRLAQRRQDFEDKMKTWERRVESNPSTSLNGHSHSHKPIPDFKSLHAANDNLLASMAARRREMIKPTVPIAPHFSTDQRLSEREKFEQARRVREEELERRLAEEQRLREEEEERAYQEARKKAVPRANAMPDWYADAPKKPSRQEQVS